MPVKISPKEWYGRFSEELGLNLYEGWLYHVAIINSFYRDHEKMTKKSFVDKWLGKTIVRLDRSTISLSYEQKQFLKPILEEIYEGNDLFDLSTPDAESVTQ